MEILEKQHESIMTDKSLATIDIIYARSTKSKINGEWL
jgi:hypothetical protein